MNCFGTHSILHNLANRCISKKLIYILHAMFLWTSTISTRPAKSTGLISSRLLGFVTSSTGLLGGRTFLLVLKNLYFLYFNLFMILIYFSVDSLSGGNRLAVAYN